MTAFLFLLLLLPLLIVVAIVSIAIVIIIITITIIIRKIGTQSAGAAGSWIELERWVAGAVSQPERLSKVGPRAR